MRAKDSTFEGHHQHSGADDAPLFQLFAQVEEAEAQATFDGAEGDGEGTGNLGLRPAVEVDEVDGGALLAGQTGQAFADNGCLDGAPGVIPDVGSGCVFAEINLFQQRLVSRVVAAFVAQVIDSAVMHDG